MTSDESPGPGSGPERLPCDDPSALRECPYCGARALRPVEETREPGGLDETLSVCAACGRSIVSPRWTAAGSRRVFLRVLKTVGPYLLVAAAGYLLQPYLPFLPRRTFGRAGGTGGT